LNFISSASSFAAVSKYLKYFDMRNINKAARFDISAKKSFTECKLKRKKGKEKKRNGLFMLP